MVSCASPKDYAPEKVKEDLTGQHDIVDVMYEVLDTLKSRRIIIIFRNLFVLGVIFSVNIYNNLQEKGEQYVHHLNNLNRHEEIFGLQEILVIISNDLLEWVIPIFLIGALFHLVEGNAEDDVKQDCNSLAVEDYALEKPIVVNIVYELVGGQFVFNDLIIIEGLAKFLMAFVQVFHNFADRSLLKLDLHLNV